MVEDNANVHVIIVTPPSVFDVAVILRALYTGLGPRGWKLTIVGLGNKLPLKLVTESRTPVSVVRENVSTLLEEPSEPIYIVDPRGSPAWLHPPPRSIVIDYSGSYSSKLSSAKRISSLGLNSLTYETIGIVYEYWIRKIPQQRKISLEPYSRDVRSGLYIAKKALEALSVFDNYVLLEPSVLAYTLRKVYIANRILLDPSSTEVKIDHIEGKVLETISIEAYSARNLRKIGYITLTYREGVLEIRDIDGLAYRIIIDINRKQACSAPDLCVSKSENEQGSINVIY
ncbi:hypothetical protein PYJP_04340 [Pyrofollis japonicus]|uniref:hypothetical protein n=1 Tax=Pyrofollis japonicus TaxID=3060460 RepID=UPI00295B3FB2|nr:hypothetical protein [Pyrofollis japonicus]BEP17082.1 hypothetical protein PYJP_04340 [Pyrofollis japonicus]